MEALSSLASEAAFTLEVEQQLGLEIQKLTAKMQVSAELDSGSVSVCRPGDRAGNLAVSLESLLNVYWLLVLYCGKISNMVIIVINSWSVMNHTPCYSLIVVATDIIP